MNDLDRLIAASQRIKDEFEGGYIKIQPYGIELYAYIGGMEAGKVVGWPEFKQDPETLNESVDYLYEILTREWAEYADVLAAGDL